MPFAVRPGGTISARQRAFNRIAGDPRLQFPQVKKNVGLTPQVVGDHYRLRIDRRNNGDPGAASLYGFNQRTKIAIT